MLAKIVLKGFEIFQIKKENKNRNIKNEKELNLSFIK